MKPRTCKQCLRNSDMICWGCYDLTVARRCMGQNLILCFSFSFHYLLFLVCVQFTRNTGKVIPLFCVWRRVLSYLFTYCYIMDLEKNVFYSSCCILTMQVMLVPEYDLWIRVKPKSKSQWRHTTHILFLPGLTRFVRQVHVLVFQISLADLLCWKFTKSINYPRTKLNLKEASLDICASNNRHPKFQCTHISYEASCLLHSFWEQ